MNTKQIRETRTINIYRAIVADGRVKRVLFIKTGPRHDGKRPPRTK